MGSQRKAKRPTANGKATAKRRNKASAVKPWYARRWAPDMSWYDDKVALAFNTEEDIDAAIDLCWSDKDLRGVPRVHVGEWTMIVPAESLPFFQKKARNFTVKNVISAGDLSPEEMAKVRRGESLD